MLTVTCFSYKGGAGRSTSAANVAAELARRGNRVAIVDADLGAPGLHYLFGVESISDADDYIGTHHLLNDLVRLDVLLAESLIDVGSARQDGSAWSLEQGKLSLLASSPDHVPALEPDDFHSRRATSALGLLRQRLEAEKYDYLFLDSESGIGPVAGICMDNSDVVLTFFRWTRQHVQGTAECIGLLHEMGRFGTGGLYTVATCVPSEDELQQIDDIVLMRALSVARGEYEEVLSQIPGGDCRPVVQIPEYVPFKWVERVVVFDTDMFADLADFVESQNREGASD